MSNNKFVAPTVEVKPTVEQKGRRRSGELDQVVAYPVLQAVAVGLAAFLLAYAPLNYMVYGVVWVALNQSANTQLSALIGVVIGASSCIIFFMLEEVSWLVKFAAEWYANIRNTLDVSEYINDINEILDMHRVALDEVNDLKRDNAVLKAQLKQRPTVESQPAVQQPVYQPASQQATYAEDVEEYLSTHYGQHEDIETTKIEQPVEEQADSHTLYQMEQARKILKTAISEKSIARRPCMVMQRMTEKEWNDGIAYLQLAGAVEDVKPRGYKLLVDAEGVLNLINERMGIRRDTARGNYTPA